MAKKSKKIVFVLNKYQKVTHVFKNIVFRSVALVTKKILDILDFYCTHTGLLPYPML